MIQTSAAIEALSTALLAFQGEVRGVRTDQASPAFKNHRYATLEAVIEAVRPGLQKVGVVFLQAPGAITDGKLSMTTMLVHAASGQWMSATGEIVLGKQDPQGVGSATTYLSRYSLMALLGLPPVDDDGQVAMQRPAPDKDESATRYIAECRTRIKEAAGAPSLHAWWTAEGGRRRAFDLSPEITAELKTSVLEKLAELRDEVPSNAYAKATGRAA